MFDGSWSIPSSQRKMSSGMVEAIREDTPRKWEYRRSEEGLNPGTVRANREQHSPGAQVTLESPE
jgi:hypothetical protein